MACIKKLNPFASFAFWHEAEVPQESKPSVLSIADELESTLRSECFMARRQLHEDFCVEIFVALSRRYTCWRHELLLYLHVITFYTNLVCTLFSSLHMLSGHRCCSPCLCSYNFTVKVEECSPQQTESNVGTACKQVYSARCNQHHENDVLQRNAPTQCDEHKYIHFTRSRPVQCNRQSTSVEENVQKAAHTLYNMMLHPWPTIMHCPHHLEGKKRQNLHASLHATDQWNY